MGLNDQRTLGLPEGGASPVKIQIFAEQVPKGLRAEAWALLGSGNPRWK